MANLLKLLSWPAQRLTSHNRDCGAVNWCIPPPENGRGAASSARSFVLHKPGQQSGERDLLVSDNLLRYIISTSLNSDCVVTKIPTLKQRLSFITSHCVEQCRTTKACLLFVSRIQPTCSWPTTSISKLPVAVAGASSARPCRPACRLLCPWPWSLPSVEEQQTRQSRWTSSFPLQQTSLTSGSRCRLLLPSCPLPRSWGPTSTLRSCLPPRTGIYITPERHTPSPQLQ
ncbi:hypothetical protein GE09DRAFT_86118 [Coniochaeta sp. 2T2.1]|nr:hypothetical protein GE09DRAFT_86118 [Coniochaeta sp. 2T2.1]